MKKFKFRLETLLRLRQQEEDECREALAKAVEATRQARETLQRIRNEQKTLERAWAEFERKPGTDVDTFRDFEAYRGVLQRRAEETQKQLDEALKHENEARTKLQEAVKKRRALKKLRERQARRHAEKALKEEQNELDESGTTRFVRKKTADAEE